MDASTDVGKIISALRHELKIRGLRNHDIASHLRVSDTTVKRYLRGQGVSLSVLQKLAEIVDLNLLSLVALARQEGAPKPRLTTVQQDALGRSALSRAVFFQLCRGMTPSQVAEALGLTAPKLDFQLAKLQGLRLISRTSNNRIDILANPHFEFDSKDQGALTNIARDLARQFLSEVDLSDERSEWFYGAHRLSGASVKRMREMIKRLLSEVSKLGKSDINLPARETQIYQFFIAAQPTGQETFLRHE